MTTGPQAEAPVARLDGIDALRGLAALLVLGYHVLDLTYAADGRPWTAALDRAPVAVALFFAISGFVLTRPFLAAWHEGRPRPSLVRFVRRRALRVFPAYWVAFGVLALWPGLPGVNGDTWLTYAVLGHTYDHATVFLGLGVSWTLCVELQFYAALVLAVALADRLPGARAIRATALVTAFAFVVAAVVNQRVRETLELPELVFSLFGYADWFAWGVVLALIATRFARPVSLWACWGAAVLVIGLDLLVGPGVGPGRVGVVGTPLQLTTQHLLLGVAAALILAPAVLPRRSALGVFNPMRLRWLQRFGLVSYGVYLWHRPIAQELAGWLDAGTFATAYIPTVFVLTLGVSTVLGELSHRFVEQPILRLDRPFGRRAKAAL